MTFSDFDVTVTLSTFGGGWIFPIGDRGRDALIDFFGEQPASLTPFGGDIGYIIEPYQMQDLYEHLQKQSLVWEQV